ncbi:glycosyltransferase [Hymenobacter sublimis]|uniref:Glycosyltransferase n=1 Tax=Hymenobacter sublimis TaxID=2933777 RepID=A0ABY4JC27_9BACT|nr:glycosyltransferase [Hymenobacter sublimis]UPL50378.1 glycosyltransferase [Hymenobacter sublimis]
MPGVAWATALALLGVNGVYLRQMLQYRQAWRHRLSSDTEKVAEKPSEARKQAAPTSAVDGEAAATPAFSVLVAARNEAANLPWLLHDLSQQLPVAGGFEVLIIDDHSTDATAQVVAEAAANLPFPVRVLQLASQPSAPTGKKAAVQTGIQAARAPWLLFTDADCRVPAGWVRTYAELVAQDADARFISGPVLLTGRGWLATLQGLELAGLVGVGAASIGWEQPTMCNGANLAYRRADFFAVDGFRGNEAVPSGDDEFLLHKLHAAFPGSIRFLRQEGAVVQTAAQPTVRLLLRQRVRWASKWRHYQAAAPRRLAVLVLLSNLTFPVGAGLWLLGVAPGTAVVAAWALKLLADVVFLRPVLRFLGRPQWLWWVPVLQLAYGPYALATGLLGLRGSYEWKGRKATSP